MIFIGKGHGATPSKHNSYLKSATPFFENSAKQGFQKITSCKFFVDFGVWGAVEPYPTPQNQQIFYTKKNNLYFTQLRIAIFL